MNKKSQAESIIIFFATIVAIFIVSIILLRFTNEVLTPFTNALAPVNNQSAQAVIAVHNSFTSVWDWVMVLVFLFNIILLFISSFLVDVHPAFIVIYVIAVIFLFIFGNQFLYVLDSLWNNIATPTETSQTQIEQFIINNFQIIMLGIVILSGVLMYAKIKLFPNQMPGGNY